MKVRLLHPDRDDNLSPTTSLAMREVIEADLELPTVYRAMAAGDSYLLDVARNVLTASLTDLYVIEYRQDALADCMEHAAIVRNLYDVTVDASQAQRKVFLGGLLSRDPNAILRRAVALLALLTENLKQVRALHDTHATVFQSKCFHQFWTMIGDQLDDDYLAALDYELAELAMPRGVLLSAQLAKGNKGTQMRLHRPPRYHWWERFAGDTHTRLAFTLSDRDQAGSDALTEITGRAINEISNIVSQAVDHIQSFFARLRYELGFYLGCLNLKQRLDEREVPIAFPNPMPMNPRQFQCKDLRDIALTLTTSGLVTGNTIDADNMRLVVVTGANEGGKSTFLRSVGSAQMMLQAGMFVTAQSVTASITTGIYTHFKREEDASMTHGKLDEELARASEIADTIAPDCLLLCNESFASTNEREGAQIARGVIDALTAANITVVFVTHLYDLARSLYDRGATNHLFLRAERLDDTTRTHRLTVGEPRATSYGMDSFTRVFSQPASTEGIQ